MRFLVDMPLSPALVTDLGQQGHEALHASAVGLARAVDSKILCRVRDESRVVITADLDYPRLLALSYATGPGLILFRGGNYSEQEAKDRLRDALAVVPEAELLRSIVVIEKNRIRRRSLPIDLPK